ncbi:MAG TPA: trypsin-like peptidase domain-containing protein [Solirubrobacteraceae bacterium]|nr:trypsin-like peptidase domain-containing protein [Solirubrobacteraceae bacterium]
MKRLFFPIVLAALVGAVVASVFFAASRRSGGTAPARTAVAPVAGSTGGVVKDVSSTTPSATQVYQRDASGVVSIKATNAEGGDSGTGIVLNEEGLILTNNHVIAEGTSLTVSPGKSTNVTRTASVVGTDPNSDLALIKVNPSGLGLHPLKLVSSNSVQVGDSVYALGNPYGLNETLTKGIVSALQREISAPDGATIKNVIQTDAPLNPGNSGGPLLNAEGDVIGVNSQIASDAARTEGSQPGSTGVGFAISSNTVSEVVKKIESGGGSNTQRTEGESQVQRSGTESSPYGTESPYQTEGPATTQGGEGESRESSPYGYESNGGAGVEGDGEVGSSGAGSAGVESGGEGREGQVMIVP